MSKLPKSIITGRVGEQYSRVVQLDVSDELKLFPDTVPSLIYRRPDEESVYPGTITFDSETGIITWQIDSVITGVQGYNGAVQILFTKSDDVHTIIGQSFIIRLVVLESLTEDEGEPPDPYDSWIASLTALGAETLANANTAQAARDEAVDARDEAVAAAGDVTGAVDTATAASTAAVAAKEAVDAVKDSILSAATTAESAKDAAVAASSSATASAGIAENYAASAAQNARAADTSAQQAEEHMNAAEEYKDNAASSMTQANASAQSAAQSAVTAELAMNAAEASVNKGGYISLYKQNHHLCVKLTNMGDLTFVHENRRLVIYG